MVLCAGGWMGCPQIPQINTEGHSPQMPQINTEDLVLVVAVGNWGGGMPVLYKRVTPMGFDP